MARSTNRAIRNFAGIWLDKVDRAETDPHTVLMPGDISDRWVVYRLEPGSPNRAYRLGAVKSEKAAKLLCKALDETGPEIHYYTRG